jgi:hypothetical protein
MRIGTVEPEDLNSDQIFLFGVGDVARVYIGVEEARRVDFCQSPLVLHRTGSIS